MSIQELIDRHQLWLNKQNEGTQLTLKDINFQQEWLQYQLAATLYEQVTFKDIFFTEIDFTGSYFFNCSFINCSFINCTLHKCELYDCNLKQNKFENTILTKSDFNSCHFNYAHFNNCDLSWSYFNECDFREVKYENTIMEGGIIVSSKMYNSQKHCINFGKNFPSTIKNIDMSINGDGSKIVEKEGLIQLICI